MAKATSILEPQANPQSTEAAALSSIVAWSSECPAWQRDALRRFCNSDQLEPVDLDQLVEICKGKASGEPLAAAHVRDPTAGLATVTLRALHSAQHVNAIAPDQRLSFDKTGVTVIYGDNGAGKSGYARVLKKVCRARSAGKEDILSNIYDANPGVPTASIDFTVNGQNEVALWTLGEPGVAALSAVSVFDSHTANVHVREPNDVAYTPLPLKILGALAQACQKIKSMLQTEITELRKQTPASIYAPTCKNNTLAGKLIAGLSADTNPADVEALATLEDSERNRLDSLSGDLAADPAKTAARLSALKEKVEVIAENLEAFAGATSGATAQSLSKLEAAYGTARAAAAAASTALFADEPLPNIGSEIWKSLWEAARSYSESEAYLALNFPVTDNAVCVLCQQDLSAEAADRMGRFEAFVKDESKKNEADAKAAYEAAKQAFAGHAITLAEIDSVVACIRDELGDDVLARQVRLAAVTALRRHRRIARHHANSPAASIPEAAAPPLAELRAQANELGTRATSLTAEAGSQERAKLVAERDQLADRVWLAGIKADVLAEIERRKIIMALETAQKDCTTYRITSKSTEIAKQVVTDALRAQFTKEIAKLEIGTLAVELKQEKSTVGIPKFKVALTRKPTANIGAVLSEGEHRCVALAAFLAELSTTSTRSAIVFDDPVSSLDHSHREAIAKRLAEEGQYRQIIVFTHDIAFLFQLDEACRDHQPVSHLAVRCVSRGAELAGYCIDNPPMRAMSVGKVIDAMQRRLDKEKIHHERGNQADWETTVRGLKEQLRTTWERAVEEVVSPVLRRLGNKVSTDGLAKLTAITVADCKAMRMAFERCSELLHSEAAGLNKPLPTPDKVQDEISALKDWLETIQQRQSAVKPA